MRTDSAAQALLYDIKRCGRLANAGLVAFIKELPRRLGLEHEAEGIHEDNVAVEDPVYHGGRPCKGPGTANISLNSDEAPDEEPYDPSWLRDVVRFVDRRDDYR